jgi:hypothetical protein
MRRLLLSTLLISGLFATDAMAQWAKQRAVLVRTEITTNNHIELHFDREAPGTYTEFQVFKRVFGESNWNLLETVDSSIKMVTDNQVEPGVVYEYNVRKVNTVKEPFSSSGQLIGHSYVTAGVDIEPALYSGVVLLLVKDNLETAISASIDTLQTDLSNSGWAVFKEVIDTHSVIGVKSLIKSYKDQHDIDAVYLLGHIPVPYSGLYCTGGYGPPDGHTETVGNHCGAWAADAYYGDFTGSYTDKGSKSAARAANTNEPGDGKFDQNQVAGSVDVAIGRVDLSNMTQFSKSEEELTAQYIRKCHAYRYHMSEPRMNGVIDENFAGLQEGFSGQGWRDFSVILGPDSLIEGDYFNEQANGHTLLGYGAGAGSFTSCNGVGNTGTFASKNEAANFNFIFGSYFGDYDIKNNFLRAPLCTATGGLTNAWSGRPNWTAHPLALGYTIGECARMTQNNRSANNYQLMFFTAGMHVALMGDPTLKAVTVVPPTDLVVSANTDRTEASLSWSAAADDNITGYYVYRSGGDFEKFVLLTYQPVTETNYTDPAPRDGRNVYVVRAAKKDQTASGSFTHLSTGSRVEIDNMTGSGATIDPVLSRSLTVYPNPANDRVEVRLDQPGHERIAIYNMQGMLVTEQVSNGSGKTSINLEGFKPGIYWVRTKAAAAKFVIH